MHAGFREPPLSLSFLKDGSHNERVSLEEEVRGGKEKHMTIQDAVNQATEGGYHINESDGMETDYAGANSEYSVWTRQDNGSSFIIPVEQTFSIQHFGTP
jgi:hypothetical protein